MRDLIVTSFTPTLGGGAALRTYGIVRALAMSRGVDVAYTVFGAPEPAPEYATIDGVRLHPIVPSRGVRRAAAYASARLDRVPAPFARAASPEVAAAARRFAAAAGRGRVIADGPTAAAALRTLARARPVVYNAHNLESAFRATERGTGAGSAAALARWERSTLLSAAESWMVSRPDMEGARRLAPDARLRYVPNVVDTGAIAPVTPSGDPVAVLVADYRYAPNQEALAFMVEEVMPAVWGSVPDARLLVVGRGLDGPPSQDPRVVWAGFVADLGAAYAEAACAVVPLLQGGGSPLKFVEALAHGLPVVATPRAAAGLDLAAGDEYIAGGDAPDSFAAALAAVLQHGAPAVAAAGRAAAEARYSINALAEILRPTS